MSDNKQKIDKKSLSLAIDATSENTAVLLQDIMNKTGKGRQALYDDIISDDEVEACREDIRAAILAEKWNIQAESLEEAFINRLWAMIERNIEEFANLALLSRFYGYAVGEYIYKQEPDGFISLDKILNKDGELDYYEPKRNGDLIYNSEGEVALDTQHKFLFLPSKATPYAPQGEMMIVRAYPAVLLRRKSWAYAGQFVERYSQPFILGEQGGYGDIKEFAQTLQGLTKGGIAAIGTDDEIKVNQLSGDASPFEVIEKIANSRIQKLILGKTRTGDLDNGSKAAQETEEQARKARISAYLNLLKNAVNHALNAVLKVNNSWGLQLKTSKIWFDYQTLENVDLVKAQRDQIYINAGLELDKSYFVEALGYEERHIKGFKTVSSEQLAVSSYKHSLQLADKPKTALADEENQEDLIALQTRLKDRLKELGILDLGA